MKQTDKKLYEVSTTLTGDVYYGLREDAMSHKQKIAARIRDILSEQVEKREEQLTLEVSAEPCATANQYDYLGILYVMMDEPLPAKVAERKLTMQEANRLIREAKAKLWGAE